LFLVLIMCMYVSIFVSARELFEVEKNDAGSLSRQLKSCEIVVPNIKKEAEIRIRRCWHTKEQRNEKKCEYIQ